MLVLAGPAESVEHQVYAVLSSVLAKRHRYVDPVRRKVGRAAARLAAMVESAVHFDRQLLCGLRTLYKGGGGHWC